MAGVSSIPASYSFLDALAQGLLCETEGHPLSLSRYTLFLPTRKDCRELQNAFLRQSQGQPLLLPRLYTLGDLEGDDELILNTPLPGLPSVMSKFKRQGLLTKLILHYTQQHDGLVSPHSAASAAQLARDLMLLIDEAQIEGVNWNNLVDLVPSHLAAHWQITLDFLKIISKHWPEIQESTGQVEPHAYNRMAVERLIRRWKEDPPLFPVIAAGSTGTRETTRKLLEIIAQMEVGEVLLPGYESEGEHGGESHPHSPHVHFLDTLGVDPKSVEIWKPLENIDTCGNSKRGALVLASLQFEPTSLSLSDTGEALKRWNVVEALTLQDEALVIAMKIRETLGLPGKTVSLISSNKTLFERVRSELKRWEIECEIEAFPLARTLQGKYMLLLLSVIHSRCDAHDLLALIKHPFVKEDRVLGLETQCLRGPILKPGFQPILHAVESNPELHDYINGLWQKVSPLISIFEKEKVKFSEVLPQFLQVAEQVSREKTLLWSGAEGESLSLFFSELLDAANDFPDIRGEDFYELFCTLMESYLCVVPLKMHPRLSFQSPQESRLKHADVHILGGFNEGSWPRETVSDPWMNPTMRRDLGLSSSEQKLALATHDFYMAFSAPEVMMTRSLRDQGTPTVPSRWLMRLDVSLKKAGFSIPYILSFDKLSRRMDTPEMMFQPQRPQPCPPVSARPRQLSVTQVETWMRDPYALYARHILKLKPLDEIAMLPTVADRGILFHKVFENYLSGENPKTYAHLISIGETIFGPFQEHLDVRFFWWPRFLNIADWFYKQHQLRPPSDVVVEVRGSLTFDALAGPFTLTAQADRIDQDKTTGALTLIDYKTGQPPTQRDVEFGLSPQLPLEAAILKEGGFPSLEAMLPESLEYWWLKGGREGGMIRKLGKETGDMAQAALQGLKTLVSYYDQPSTTYPAVPWFSRALRYNDYTHLARVQEWRESV